METFLTTLETHKEIITSIAVFIILVIYSLKDKY